MPFIGKLIDLQVNGYLGIAFSDRDLTQEDCIHAFSKYIDDGASQFLPTVITSPEETLHHVFPILCKAREEGGLEDSIPGFHLEGPFISKQPGAIGAHNSDWTLAPDLETFKRIQESANGLINLITIAAELDGAAEFCEAVTDKGVSVSLGHQLASYDDLSRLADAGAKTLTHLGNATPHMVNKFDNPFVSGLMHPSLRPMIITDGHHLPPHIVKGIIRLRGANDLIFVSDASPLAGLSPGAYHALGNDCVIDEDGKLYNPHAGHLVGSSFTMQRCADFLSDSISIPDDAIHRMGYLNPMEVIGHQ
jgi:N-acetylglucosamine-6-phosphate deacetylase